MDKLPLLLGALLLLSYSGYSNTVKIVNESDSDIRLVIVYGGDFICKKDSFKIEAHTTLNKDVGFCCTRTTKFTANDEIIAKPHDTNFPGNMADIRASIKKKYAWWEKGLEALVALGSFGIEPIRDNLSELTCKSWSAKITGQFPHLEIK